MHVFNISHAHLRKQDMFASDSFLHPSLYSDVTALKAGQWKLVLLLACYVRSMSNNCLYTVVFLVKDRKQVQEGRKG